MKNHWILSIVITLSFVFLASASKKDEHDLKEKQAGLDAVKAEVEDGRDSLENEVARRYGLKQKLVDQREADKQEMDRLRDAQERAANELARVKEECLAREQTVADERKAAQAAVEEWSNVKVALSDAFKKEADAVLEAFPWTAKRGGRPWRRSARNLPESKTRRRRGMILSPTRATISARAQEFPLSPATCSPTRARRCI